MLVLVVDDSKAIREYLAQSIKAEGHDIILACDGNDAIQKFSMISIDLVLMDAEMPECDGFNATRQIRTIKADEWIPIIFLSAHLEDEYIQKALDSGADVYLRKPINTVELHGQIRAMSRIADIRIQLAKANRDLLLANEELNKQANVDGLTGIANRRNFDQRLLIEINHAVRNRHPLSIILGDIDFFKQYNDTYGHLEGDNCLIRVARTLDSTFHRATDLVARYGGEEFVIILPNTDRAKAENMAAKVLENITALHIPHRASTIADHVTISLGIHTIMTHLDPSAFISLADAALYYSKHSGRNRFSSYDTLPDSEQT